MRIIFVSFDEEGWQCLNKIMELNGNVVGVFTLEEELRKKMSGNKAFDDLAEKYNIPLFKIRNINDEKTLKQIQKLNPDISFVVGWSQLVKREYLSLSKNRCIGIHPTLLPKHRGRAPLPWAIIFGLRKTGVTMFYIKEEADNGDIIGQVEVDITDEDDAKSLYQKILAAHVKLIEEYFPLILSGNAPRIPQDERRASYWTKRVPRDGIIDWNTCACSLYDWIRALTDPYPGAFTFLNDKKLFVWKSRLISKSGTHSKTGEIIEIDQEGLTLSTGQGLLKVTSVQLEGENRLEGPAIYESHIFHKGEQLG